MCDSSKNELLWVEWQTLARHYTEDEMVVGEWFADIVEHYSRPHRKYHTTDHLYQMILNFKQFYQQLTFPRTVLFAIFFHDIVYDPKSSDNETRSIEEFESCAEDLSLEGDLVRDVREMIQLTAQGHFTEEHQKVSPKSRDIHYFLDIDLSILGSNPVEYMLYAKRVREEYNHVTEQEFCVRRAQVMERFLEREYVYATREFRQFAEENAQRNVRKEVKMLRARAKHLASLQEQHTCGGEQAHEGDTDIE